MTSADDNSRESRLEKVLADYLRAVESEQPLDEQALVNQYPDLADELQSFFRNRAAMQQLARPLQVAVLDPTLGVAGNALVGELLRIRYFGDYELLAELGRGGMGVVYRARQTTLNRPVALKMIIAGQLASAGDVQRFRQEAEAAANLDHPHIAPVYETGEHNGQQYFSMKLIEGRSLREALPELRSNLRAGVQLLAHVARGVHHAHQRGVLHRDLKPANILLDAEMHPYVTDFGLAKRVEGDSALTQTGAVVGTPAYMAPEQALGEKQLTTAVDVYGLGAILYELLTGRAPFQGASPMETLLQVMSHEPQRPSSVTTAIDRDLETIAVKCLEKDPTRRYDSAAALADDLERWLRGEPIVARRITTWERARKWALRRPAVAALLLVSAFAFLVLIAGFVTTDLLLRNAHRQTLAEKQKTDDVNKLVVKEQLATQAALDRLQHVAYGQRLTLARVEWEASNIERALQLLDECPQKFRHWEWNYLHRLCHSELRSFPCKTAVRAIAFHPDCQSLIAGGGAIGFGPFLGSQQIVRWNVADGAPLPNFHEEPPYGAITGLAWEPQGELLAMSLWCMTDARDVVLSAGRIGEEEAGRIEIWNGKTSKLIHALKGHHSFVNGVAISHDGQRVASASSDQTAQVWNITTGKREFTLSGHKGQLMCVAFSPDGKWIATGSQGPLSDFGSRTPNDFGEVKIWNAADGTELKSLAGHNLGVLSLAFSPDSAQLATASRDRLVKLWDVANGTPIRTLYGHTDDVASVVFSADGKIIATGSSDRTARIWNAADGQPLAVLRGHTQAVAGVAFHKDNRHLASCSNGREVKTWDLSSLPEVVTTREKSDEVLQIATSANGERIAAFVATEGSRRHELRVFDGRDGQLRFTLPDPEKYLENVQLTPDGNELLTIASNDTLTISRFNLNTEQPEKRLENTHIKQYEKGDVASAISPALTADGKAVASYDYEPEAVTFRDAKTGQELWRGEHPPGQEIYLQLSRDERVLVAVTNDRFDQGDRWTWRTVAITAWEVVSHKELVAIRPTDFYGWKRAVCPRGRYVALAREQQRPGVRLWNLQRSEEPRDFATQLPNCHALQFSSDGQRILTVHSFEAHVEMRLWDVATGNETAVLREFSVAQLHGAFGEGIQFSPDSRRIFTAIDGTVKVWSAESGILLLTLRPAEHPMQLSVDGRRVVAAGPQGVLQIWTADTP